MLLGELAGTGLGDVLTTLADGAATGCLHLRQPDGAVARLFLRSGRIHALEPPDADLTEPAWPVGSWRFQAHERAGAGAMDPGIVPAAALGPLAALGQLAALGRRAPATPVHAADLDTAEPLVDDVSRAAARAAAAITTFYRAADRGLPAAPLSEPVDAEPVDAEPVNAEPVNNVEDEPVNAEPHARPDTDLAALMRELSSLGMDDEPAAASRPTGSLMAAAAQKRRKGLFGRPA